jgi:hypothetical protein
MHTTKDSMWRVILKIFRFWSGSKQNPNTITTLHGGGKVNAGMVRNGVECKKNIDIWLDIVSVSKFDKKRSVFKQSFFF